MNYQETLKAMIEAAAGVAKNHWNALRGFAEEEFKSLSESASWLEADFLADMAATKHQTDLARRAEMEQKAKLRATLAYDNLKLAAGGLITVAKADAKIAAQDAINAALDVLRAAVNKSIGLALL